MRRSFITYSSDFRETHEVCVMDDEAEYDVLSTVAEIMNNDQSFHQIVRFLDSGTRNTLMAAQMRNTHVALNLLRTYMNQERVPTMVMNIPLNADFLEAVNVAPSEAQLTAAVDRNVPVVDTNCSICQEEVASATRIRHCSHCFHEACIATWFRVNPRCPVCRHDVRDLNPVAAGRPNDSRMHTDGE